MIHHGDCLDVMAGMEPESVDSICTDPPYGLEFMGKEWDRLGATTEVAADDMDTSHPFRNGSRRVRYGTNAKTMQAWHEAWAREALRVAKPSAYLLAFGGTRTVHRMTVALEDAGWIIRDMLVWAYASGFPKSKASLKPAWEPIVMARKPGPLRELAIDACRIGTGGDKGEWPITNRDTAAGLYTPPPVLTDQTLGRWPSNVILTDPIFDGGVEGVVGGGASVPHGTPGGDPRRLTGYVSDGWGSITDGHGDLYGDSGTYSRFFILPKADRSDREPVLDEYAYALHRQRGECDKLRVWASADLSQSDPTASTSPARATFEATSTDDSPSDTSQPGSPPTDPSPTAIRSTTSTATRPTTGSRTSSSSILSPTNGSTPAANSETASGGSPAASAGSSSESDPTTGTSPERAGRSTDAAAPATSPKSSSRNACGVCGRPLPRVGSHPTVKPVDLMRHLVRLVTPTGGLVLDPFLGSGTTGLACELEGFPWLGIEREAEYVAIAEARLNGTQKGLGLPA